MIRCRAHPSGGRRAHRGLTLLELVLALIITSVIAMGTTAMMAAVTSGVIDNRDQRSVMVRANAAQSRLAAYISPSLCILGSVDGVITLWFQDSRESRTVHATELRWLVFDDMDNVLYVHKVEFPAAWTETSKNLIDTECAPESDWEAIMTTYAAKGWTVSTPIIDGLEGLTVTTDQATPMASQQIELELTFFATDKLVDVRVSNALQYHLSPEEI
ncbi:MAG: prepilin-type N-terminal cleavage/methylation domain-containing protein [Planctomycetota bacterium]|jgi:prepilin-type N-terminal cleavage/methylation domain-containing protein